MINGVVKVDFQQISLKPRNAPFAIPFSVQSVLHVAIRAMTATPD